MTAAVQGRRVPDPLPVVLAVPLVFVVEVVLGGPFGVYFGVPVRYALFFASFALLSLMVVRRAAIHPLMLAPAATLVGFVAVQALWATVVPAVAGTNVKFALLEFRPLLLLLLPAFALVVCGTPEALERAVRRMQRAVVGACLVLAVAQIAIWVAGSLLPQLQVLAFIFLGRAFAGAEAFLYVGPMPDGFFRVFWISSFWHPVAYFWLPTAIPRPLPRLVARGLIVMAIFVAYSRGIWLGMAAGMLVAAVASVARGEWARALTRRAVTLAVAGAALVPVLAATGQLDRAVDRLTSTAPRQVRQGDERVQQIAPLVRVWERSPLFGVGYGGYARDYVRMPETPYSYENTTYALLAKLGAVGMGAMLAGFGYWAARAWRARRAAPADAPAFLGAFVATLLGSTTNPMLLNFVGMSIMATLLLQASRIAVLSESAGAEERA